MDDVQAPRRLGRVPPQVGDVDRAGDRCRRWWRRRDDAVAGERDRDHGARRIVGGERQRGAARTRRRGPKRDPDLAAHAGRRAPCHQARNGAVGGFGRDVCEREVGGVRAADRDAVDVQAVRAAVREIGCDERRPGATQGHVGRRIQAGVDVEKRHRQHRRSTQAEGSRWGIAEGDSGRRQLGPHTAGFEREVQPAEVAGRARTRNGCAHRTRRVRATANAELIGVDADQRNGGDDGRHAAAVDEHRIGRRCGRLANPGKEAAIAARVETQRRRAAGTERGEAAERGGQAEAKAETEAKSHRHADRHQIRSIHVFERCAWVHKRAAMALPHTEQSAGATAKYTWPERKDSPRRRAKLRHAHLAAAPGGRASCIAASALLHCVFHTRKTEEVPCPVPHRPPPSARLLRNAR